MAACAHSGQVQTVNGPLDPSLMGQTLMHEHLFIDFMKFYKPPSTPEETVLAEAPIQLQNLHWVQYHVVKSKANLTLEDVNLATKEVAFFKSAGGSTLVEATTKGIGRDPEKIKAVSSATGINIVVGAGFYVGQTHPVGVQDLTVHDLEEIMLKEVEQGIDGTSIKAGIVGEIGTSWPITEDERKVLIAAARAAKRAGTMLNVHPGRHEDAPMACLNIVKEAAGPEFLKRTVMSHIDRTLFSTAQHEEIARTGATLEFDLFGMEISHYPLPHHKRNIYMPSDHQRIEWVQAMIDRGYSAQVVLSHDIYTKHRLREYGGHGYAHILTNIVPRMKHVGISEAHIHELIVANPRRLLTKI